MPATTANTVDEVLHRKLPGVWELAPELATHAGVTGHDHRLPDPSRRALEERLQYCQGFADELAEAAPQGLRESHDVTAFQARLEAWRYATEDLNAWKRNPDPLSDLGGLLFQVVANPGDDTNAAFVSLAARCRAIPAFLEGYRQRLDKPDRLWVQLAGQVAEAMPALFESLPQAASDAGACGETISSLADAAGQARDASDDHRRWLEALTDAETVEDSWLLSDDQYEGLLARKGLGLNVDEVEAIGWQQLELRSAQRDSHRRPTSTPPADFDEALALVRDIAVRSRAFVVQQAIATLPEREELAVEPTPAFLRPLIPFAALMASGRFAPLQRSVYLVSEPAEGDLSDFRPERITGVAVHEGYPGHHLQLAAAHRLCSPLRSLQLGSMPREGAGALGVDLVEGWAHYCEELMLDHGFGDCDEARWCLRNDQVWRAVRIILDVQLCRGQTSVAAAVEMLVRHTAMAKSAAEAEVNRYTRYPGYQLCYLIGKLKLEQLKADLEQAWQDSWSLQRFHDLVLSAGRVPVEMLRRFEQEQRDLSPQ
jgi:uncharacterized protein (DUF885 family)